nr:MAG TPA: NGN Early transcription elongation factor of RNA pol II, NGN section [Caudoviricetes sp.]
MFPGYVYSAGVLRLAKAVAGVRGVIVSGCGSDPVLYSFYSLLAICQRFG